MKTDLSRFIQAQEKDFAIALEEIKKGKKQSHWMWYIFPQIQGLGHSPNSQYYASPVFMAILEKFFYRKLDNRTLIKPHHFFKF